MVMSDKTAIFQIRIMTLFCFNLLGDYCNPQHRVTSIVTAFGPPNFQMEVTPLFVCQSVEKAPFSGLKLTSVYILGDDLSL